MGEPERKLRPGEVDVANGRKTVYLTVGVWLADDGQIHLSFGREGITTVSNNPRSRRYHQKVYSHIKNILMKLDRWDPAPNARHLGDPSQLTINLGLKEEMNV